MFSARRDCSKYEALLRRALPAGGLQRKQSSCVGSQNLRSVFLRHVDSLQAPQHLLDAADLMRVVAPRQNLAGSGKGDSQLNCPWVEVNRVVIEPLQV